MKPSDRELPKPRLGLSKTTQIILALYYELTTYLCLFEPLKLVFLILKGQFRQILAH